MPEPTIAFVFIVLLWLGVWATEPRRHRARRRAERRRELTPLDGLADYPDHDDDTEGRP